MGFRFHTKGFLPRRGGGPVPRKRHLPVTFPRVGARPWGLGAAEALRTGPGPWVLCAARSEPACVFILFPSGWWEPIIQR